MRLSTSFASSTLCSLALLCAALPAQAAPQQTSAAATASRDDLELLMAEKGLLEHISQVRHSMGDRASALVENAMGFLGVRYQRGGNSVETGFDCSGFVRATYEQTIGLLLPRKAEQQAAATLKIDRNELKPGDLVFFNTMRRAFSHVGIYVGNDQFIHAPRSGAAVRIENMGVSYWAHRFDGARRVANGGGDAGAGGALTRQQAAALMGQAASQMTTPSASTFQAFSAGDTLR